MTRSIFTDAYATFLDALIQARVAACVTQAELATRLGKPQSFVSKVETGARRLDVVEFYAVAKALGCEPSALFSTVALRLPEKVAI